MTKVPLTLAETKTTIIHYGGLRRSYFSGYGHFNFVANLVERAGSYNSPVGLSLDSIASSSSRHLLRRTAGTHLLAPDAGSVSSSITLPITLSASSTASSEVFQM